MYPNHLGRSLPKVIAAHDCCIDTSTSDRRLPGFRKRRRHPYGSEKLGTIRFSIALEGCAAINSTYAPDPSFLFLTERPDQDCGRNFIKIALAEAIAVLRDEHSMKIHLDSDTRSGLGRLHGWGPARGVELESDVALIPDAPRIIQTR